MLLFWDNLATLLGVTGAGVYVSMLCIAFIYPDPPENALPGAIPIVSEELHTGRNSAERNLPYYYVLKAAAEARLRTGRALPYCERWGEHNARKPLAGGGEARRPARARPALAPLSLRAETELP